VLRITAVSAGAVDYLIRGSGCAEHDHHDAAEVDLDPEVGVQPASNRSAGADEPERGHGSDAGVGDAAGYLGAAVRSGEPAGRWLGRGLALVGAAEGEVAGERPVREVFGRLCHPESGESLGRPPRQFTSYGARLAGLVAGEVLAPTPERLRELELEAKTDGRKAVAYYDFTFSAVKSVSVYYAALLAEGYTAEADLVASAHRDAVAAAMDYAEQHIGYTRVGYHGRTAEGRSVGRYAAVQGLVMTAWEHSTNREGEPQLHTHVAVLNRARTVDDGKVRALDGRGFGPIKDAIATAYERGVEQRLEESVGVVFATRPDGKAREILGVEPALCAEASTRRAQVLARQQQLIEAYVQRHGREPGPAARRAMAQAAVLDTRRPKDAVAGQVGVLAWCRGRGRRLTATLDAVADAATAVATTGHPEAGGGDRPPDMADLAGVLAVAVADVQARYASWTLGNLIAAVDRHLPGTDLPGELVERAGQSRVEVLEALARRVVEAGNGFGVLDLGPPDPVEMPAALRRREDGRPVLRPHLDARYTTTSQLAAEQQVVVSARALSAPAVTADTALRLRGRLAGTGLTADQLDAVIGVMGSGRAGDVLIGPAGAGKSRTLAALAHAWIEQFGTPVLGLATSQHAANVLTGEGLDAVNTAAFLHRHGTDGLGEPLVCGGLYVIDEASMTSTTQLARISDLVRAGGGKVLFTGDPHQLDAVEAGGLLELLATDNGAFELTGVHRFLHGWEREASARLRVGDPAAVLDYDDRGRLYGGTREDMHSAAVRGYLADVLSGHESVLIVGSNAEATRLSEAIRAQLITLGRIDPAPLAILHDGTQASAGDLVAARRNDRSIPVGDGWVTNRETYTVLGPGPSADGGLIVARVDDKAVAHLPATYVAQWVDLAYAATVHAAQGRTTDTAHALLGENTYREDGYVAMTRGREANTAYLICERTPDMHDAERLAESPPVQLARILQSSGVEPAARLARRAARSEAVSMAWIGGQYDLVAAEYARDRYTDTLATLLPAEVMEQLVVEPGYPRLMRAVREAELTGHRPHPLLAEATAGRGLGDAASVADVLRWRIRHHAAHREPEQTVDPGDWTTWAPPMDGPIGQYLHEMAVLASQRQHHLGHTVATEQPAWATTVLGQLPGDPARRQGWIREAGGVGAYRELDAIPDGVSSIGPAPSREQVLHRVMWRHVGTVLKHYQQPDQRAPGREPDYRAASAASLREWVAQWQRAQTWAPRFVADQLSEAHLRARECRRDATFAHAQLANLDPNGAAHATLNVRATRVAQTAEQTTQHTHQLEQAHHERCSWTQNTRHLQQHAHAAAEELARRGLDVHPGTSPPEQACGSKQVGMENHLATPDDQPLEIAPNTAERGGPRKPCEAGSDTARIHQESRKLLAATAQQLHHTTHSHQRSNGATAHDADIPLTSTERAHARRDLDSEIADRTRGHTRDRQHSHDHDYEQGIDC
jgi:conjugative relaxase-like TrwC/TraI family protein